MDISFWLAIAAVVTGALAILPGSLGVLMLTGNYAATDQGARVIYNWSVVLLVLSLVLAVTAVYFAIENATYSTAPFIVAALAYAGILIFGFFMHTKLMFKPVKNPVFISIEDAEKKFGSDEEIVGVVDRTGQPWAFIARLARRPHIVYQPKGSEPFIMTHCILAHSSMAYAMKDQFRQPDLTITAALSNNLVFYDKSNQCSVIQIQNQSRNQELPLETVPTVTCKLKTWKKMYPDSPVWMRPKEWRDVFYLKLLARADVIDPDSPVMVYPLQHDLDERLPMKSEVIGVRIGNDAIAYPVHLFSGENQKIINDTAGGTSLVVISAEASDFIQVYDRMVDGRVLTFRAGEADDDNFLDEETGSRWTPTGRCVDGELMGMELTPIPHYNKIFWYVWSDFNPETRIYDAGSTSPQQAA